MSLVNQLNLKVFLVLPIERQERGHFIKIKGSVYQEYKAILNVNALSDKTLRYMSKN